MPEPAHAEFVRSVGDLVSKCGVMRGEIRSRNVPRRRQKGWEDGKGDRQSTEIIRLTDRDTNITLEAGIVEERYGWVWPSREKKMRGVARAKACHIHKYLSTPARQVTRSATQGSST